MAGSRPENAASRINKRPAASLNNVPPARRVRAPYEWLTQRRDFLKAANGLRVHHSAFVLQTTKNDSGQDGVDTGSVRFGLTVSKKNGNAVKRNRIKRRLRAALSQACAGTFEYGGKVSRDTGTSKAVEDRTIAVRPGHDYVIVARPSALVAPFDSLVAALQQAAEKIHATSVRRSGNKKSPRPDARPQT
jgi:ribonuclease P protein component